MLGCTDVAESRRLGQASIVLLYHFAEAILRSGQSCIIESLFYPEFSTPDLLALQARCQFAPLQIYCKAAIPLLLERRKWRVESGERHPGHFDHQREASESSLMPEDLRPLPLDGPVIEVDTNDFAAIDYPQLLARIRAALFIPSAAEHDIAWAKARPQL